MNEEPNAIEVLNLRKSFGNLTAVKSVSFTVKRRQVVGFIGANGAGKTTTMRILATLELPTAGTVKIEGIDVVDFPELVRHRIGWMPDHFGTYDNVTVWEYLDFYARAYGLLAGDRERRLKEVMEFTDLASIADRDMNRLSTGMGQRLCLGRTLLSDPGVLILDEPAAGLDPKARIEFKNLIRLLAEQGKTIFISSHILSELDEMCDALLFIDHGEIVHFGQTAALKTNSSEAVFNVQVEGPPEALYAWIRHQGNLNVKLLDRHRTGGRLVMPAAMANEAGGMLRRMIGDGIPVCQFHREERRLEEAFVEMLRGGQAAPLPVPEPHERAAPADSS
ncbi:MAG: ABC transporter ATP-binding protein [Verrucomicrobiota bacterium]